MRTIVRGCSSDKRDASDARGRSSAIFPIGSRTAKVRLSPRRGTPSSISLNRAIDVMFCHPLLLPPLAGCRRMGFGCHRPSRRCAEAVCRGFRWALDPAAQPPRASFAGPAAPVEPLGVRGASAGSPGRPGRGLRLGWQVDHAYQVVGGRHQVAGQPGTVHAPVARAPQAAHGLHPAEDLLHPLAQAEAHGVAGMTRRATIDGRVLLLLGDMRGR